MNYLIARVSDESQIEALPGQTRKLKNYAKDKDWLEGRDYVYIEYDETAFFKKGRKKFNELVIEPLLAEKELAIVVFDKIDRFSRDSSSEERKALTDLFRKGKIELHFPGDNLFIHKDSPAADLFRLDIGVALAGYYSSAIRDNVKRRFDQLIEEGVWISKGPIGYKNYIKGYDERNKPIKDIKLDEERSRHILKGFELRSTGLSYGAIAKTLKKDGLTGNKRRNRELRALNKGKWEEVINNPFYMGEMLYKGKQYPHKYPVLVEPWLWFKCQDVRRERSHHRTQYRSKPFLFKRLRCKECNCTVSFDGPKGKGLNTYGRCTGSSGVHTDGKWVNEKELIAQVTKKLATVVVPKQILPSIIAEIEQNHEDEQKYYLGHKKRLQSEYDSLDEEIKSLFEDRKHFKSRMDIFESMVNKKGDRQKMILKELDDHSNGNQAFAIGASYILEVASKAVELFTAESTSLEQKRYLLDFVFTNLQLEGKTLELTLKTPFDVIAKTQKINEWCG